MSRSMSKALAIAIIASLAVVLLPVSAGAELPGFAAGPWRDSTANPVLPLGSAGSWNESAMGAASVILDGSTYKMWVTGFKADGTSSIGYATSSDGKTWTPYVSNPLTTLGPGGTGSWNQLGVGSPSVIKDGATSYKMWYTAYRNDAGENIPGIGYATSTDGITWTPSGSNPVMSAGAVGTFTEDGVLSPSVILDGTTYKMWFTGRSQAAAGQTLGTLSIGYVTSTDGVGWSPAAGTLVLSPNPANSWESRGVGPATVVKDGATYYMWYTGTSGTGLNTRTYINGATSSNGTTWTPSGSNPLLSGTASTWTAMGVGSVTVVKQTGDLLRFWYSGIDTNAVPKSGYAYSIDADGQTALQGGGRTSAGRVVSVTVKVFPQGASNTDLNNGTGALATITTNTMDTGSNNVTFMISNIGVAAGTYDITIKTAHTLMNVKRSVAISPPQVLSLGTLLEGNCNNDTQINTLDFTTLAASYLKTTGQAGFNATADFDLNGQVNTLDFTLLASNYLKTSPVSVP